jgi:hypothetical protein
MRRFIDFALIVVLTVFLSAGLVQGQDDQSGKLLPRESVHSFVVSLGLNDFHLKDEYLSPYIFGGLLFSPRASLQIESEDTRHSIDVWFSIGHPNSDIQPRDVTQRVGYISYSFSHEVHTWEIGGRPLRVYLGTGLSSFATYTDFNTVDKVTGFAFYDDSWYLSHALNLNFLCEYRLAEHRTLCVQLTMPAVRLVSRPNNGHFFDSKNAKVIENFLNALKCSRREFFWNNLAILSEIEYREQLSDRFDLRGSYSFVYASSDRPLSMGMYTNNFLIGIAWLF